jgi:TonB family protein
MESKFRQQYDDRIQKLQKELEGAQKEAEERERLEQERLAAEQAELERLAAEEAELERLAAVKAEQERLAAEKAEQEQEAAAGGTQPGGGPRVAGQRPPTAPEPEPRVRLGDLVSFGPGVNPPELISIPEVRYPPMARKLGKEATVEVRLLIDETGRVARTETVGMALGFGFEGAAIEAAERARYRPATKDGVRVKMWTRVKLRFENP